MRITIARKREIAAGIGITREQFDAHLRREAAKRKAMKSMTPEQRRAFEQAEASEHARYIAERRAARMKRDGIDVHATRIEEAPGTCAQQTTPVRLSKVEKLK